MNILSTFNETELNQIIKVIKRIREPEEYPSQSLTSFDFFECDLCKGDVEKTKLTQCPYCGRWICKENCWNEKNLACISCSSIIRLAGRKEDLSYKENENKIEKKDDNKGVFKKIRQKIKNLRK